MHRRRLIILTAVVASLGIALPLAGRAPSLPRNARVDRVIVRKSERVMMLMKKRKVVRSYHIALGQNPVGPKQQEGDSRTPEGKYVIDWRNPKSRYHLSLHISYPSKADIVRALLAGASPGGDIMIHGIPNGMESKAELYESRDWTDGCIAVTNPEIEEIWKLVAVGTPVEIRP